MFNADHIIYHPTTLAAVRCANAIGTLEPCFYLFHDMVERCDGRGYDYCTMEWTVLDNRGAEPVFHHFDHEQDALNWLAAEKSDHIADAVIHHRRDAAQKWNIGLLLPCFHLSRDFTDAFRTNISSYNSHQQNIFIGLVEKSLAENRPTNAFEWTVLDNRDDDMVMEFFDSEEEALDWIQDRKLGNV